MREVFTATSEADQCGMPVEEVLGERRLTRRDLLTRGAAGVAVLAVGAGWPSRGADEDAPRIAIVGAGLAGIRCAHQLWTGHGPSVRSTIYEADTTHLGGRCWSLRGFFSDDLIGEHGGAFINTDQWAIRDLVSRLGLKLEVAGGGDLPKGKEIFRFDDAPYTWDEATDDFHEVGHAAFRRAKHSAPFPQTYDDHTPEGERLDHLSVPEWLDESGIGSTSRFGRLMLANVVSEYGGDPEDQSALNLIGLLAGGGALELTSYDEKFHVVGGNDQIVQGMVQQLPPGTIEQGQQLVALARRSNGTYRLTFDVDGVTHDVIADHVVLALPFSTLRDVDLSKAGFSPRKLDAINTMGMGQNAKIHVELKRKPWPPLGYSGSTYTDWDGFCVAWDDSVPRGRHGKPAILLGYPGGSTGRDTLTGAGHAEAPAADVDWFLDQIEPIFPGTKDAYTGMAYEDHWSVDPWHRGAYSYYRVGQYSAFAGYERVPEGNVHFAGEHTDLAQQGFLDGAVRSGVRAATEIRERLQRRSATRRTALQ